VGHYDTWLIDQEQILVHRNHNTILYPTWSNPACDYLDTPERFPTVPLHSEALDTAINNLNIPTAVRAKFSLAQKYLCHIVKTIAPILPIHGQASFTLFEKLMLERPGEPNDQMALQWTMHVDAVEVFPTSVFYLQMHYKNWKRNQRVKDCVNIMVSDAELIDSLNFMSLRNTEHEEAQPQDGHNVADVQWPVDNAMRPGFQILADSVVAGRTHEEPMIVGTTAVDRKSTLDFRPITKRKIGGREKDKIDRNARRCMR
jgi:hypothetical protein